MKTMKKGKKISFSILGTIIGILVVAIAGGYFYVSNMLNKVDKVDVDKDKLALNEDLDNELSTKYKDIQNIALFGIDNVDGMTGRSDSIMILTLDKGRNKAKVTSIMRDSYVTIPGRPGQDKINHAYAYGGPELAMRTINENFGLNIKDFITVNFTSLPKIIDLIGGIEVNIDDSELKFINSYVKNLNSQNNTAVGEISHSGNQLLNGTQAMAYCRIRYTEGGDYKRTERHRDILEKIFEKAQTMSVTEYPGLLNQALPMVKTNLDSNSLLGIGTDLVKIGGKLEQDRFPRDNFSEGKTINKIYYLTFDEVKAKEEIRNWIFEDKK
ncbi:MAG: LCP family protein [Sarcina sp.]